MKRSALHLAPLLALSLSTLTAGAALAYPAHVWINADAFTRSCGVNNTYAAQMYAQAKAGYAFLGFSPVTGVSGSGFTKAAFLSSVFGDFAVYVHSHGDVYNTGGAAFDSDATSQTPPCNGTKVYANYPATSNDIRRATKESLYNLVIMATCYLGNAYKWNSSTGKAITTKPNMMPDAFGIAKVKTSSDPEFYLGYSTKTYDGTAQAFERRFFEYLGTHPGAALKQAFDYANMYTDYGYPDANDPFVPNWYGNPNYTGIPTGFPTKGGS